VTLFYFAMRWTRSTPAIRCST